LLLIGRRVGAIGSSASRLYALPESVRARLLEVERRHDTPIIHANTTQSAPLIYAPTLLTRTDGAIPSSQLNPPTAASSVRHDFESLFARGADPWHYDSAYEQRKYEQTLSLVPRPPVERALELACAEGHFTTHLAPHVKQLLATDISEIALQRAAQRCQSSTNVEFQTLDLASDQLPRDFDLIVCSEMLYFVGDLEALRATAQKIAGALRAGGVFITAHARVVSDESDATGYAWDMPFGAATIIDVFSSTAPLRLVRELRTPLYRIALFEAGTIGHGPPEVTKVNFELPLPEIAAQIVWSATPQQTALVSRHPRSSPKPTHLPILMYHHVAPAGDAARTRYRVHPDALEAQLRYLRDCGFTSVGLEGWRDVVEGRSKHPARPVLLTFDDAYVDFEEYAWPLLRRYGFSAALFVVAGTVGGSNCWDKDASAERLLDWLALRRLHEQGVTIGAHSVTHPRMTELPTSEIARELIESRASLERELGVPVRTFAYPFGDEDEVVQHLTGAAGYLHGLSCRPGHSATRRDSWLALPRIEVTGFDDLPSFIAKLAP
jgi:peptidoglycan/xylan/chitin deacetylase (PgdA/CDA1 family)